VDDPPCSRAGLFTIANGFCGVATRFWVVTFLATGARAHLYTAALFVPFALVFDECTPPRSSRLAPSLAV